MAFHTGGQPSQISPIRSPNRILIPSIFMKEHCWNTKCSSVHCFLSYLFKCIFHSTSPYSLETELYLLRVHSSRCSDQSPVLCCIYILVFTPGSDPKLPAD